MSWHYIKTNWKLLTDKVKKRWGKIDDAMIAADERHDRLAGLRQIALSKEQAKIDDASGKADGVG